MGNFKKNERTESVLAKLHPRSSKLGEYNLLSSIFKVAIHKLCKNQFKKKANLQLYSFTNTVISYCFAYSSRWLPKP